MRALNASGWRRLALPAVVWLILVSASAIILLNAQRGSEEELETRFGLRSELTAQFVENYASDFIAQERLAAQRTLGGTRPTRKAFELLVASLESEAAVLLDSDGRALQVAPAKKSLIGTDLASQYAHLESAVNGDPAVSNVVPSAAEGIPIVAFATPFRSVDGRRVFSGAFDIQSTPLARYLSSAAALKPNRAYLVDEAGVVLATNDPESRESAALPPELASFGSESTEGSHTEQGDFVVSKPIEGTSWQLLMYTPQEFLYSTIDGTARVVPWLVWIGFAAGGLLIVWLVMRLARRRQNLVELNAKLDRQANVDPLTGVANRRRMEHEIAREISRATRDGEPLSILAIDVDRFKQINDSSGHRMGDEVLRGVAEQIGATLRDTDVLGRWGGDEFLVALPRIDAQGAATVARRLIERVRTHPFIHEGGVIPVTVSVGCAQWADEGAETLVHRADEALYVAKETGRDRFETASQPVESA